MAEPQKQFYLPQPEAAARLRARIPALLQEWETLARAALPAARAQSGPVLRDNLPKFLDRLCDLIGSGTDPRSDAPSTVASEEHAEQRAGLREYSLEQVIHEYYLLRRVLIDFLALETHSSPELSRLIHGAVDCGIEDAAVRYVAATQQDLHQSEERCRLLVEGVRDYALCMLDQRGCVVDWNEGAERITGYSEREIHGQDFALFYPEAARSTAEQALRTAAEQGRHEEEGWRVRKGGERFWASVVLACLRDTGGGLRGFSLVMRDISERRRVELERAQIQSVTDAALAYLALDDLLPALLARVREALAADTVTLLLLDDDALVVRAALGLPEESDSVRIPRGQGLAGRIAEASGPLAIEEIRPEEIVSPVLRESGVRSLLGTPLLVSGRVIGVLHLASFQPRRFSVHEMGLLQVVADRVALAIEHARLVEELRTENQRKSDFLALLAHEVRTPLSAVSNALYILENMDLSDARSQRQLETMQRQVRQLSRLAEDLLDVSRIAKGKLQLHHERVPLNALVAEAVDAVQPLADSRGQDLRRDLLAEEIRVRGDAARLTQVVTNLLNNAVTYTEPGGTVSIRLERESDHAVLRVTDTGIGIDPPVLPQIFDMFHQAAPEERGAHGGLGIGLALVKRLVAAHGGTVTAHSEGRGSGSEFTVRLPILGKDEGRGIK